MWWTCHTLLRVRCFAATWFSLECPLLPAILRWSKIQYLHIWFNRHNQLANKDLCHANVFDQRTYHRLPFPCIFAVAQKLYWGLITFNTFAKFNYITLWVLTHVFSHAPTIAIWTSSTQEVPLCPFAHILPQKPATTDPLGPHTSSLLDFLLLFLWTIEIHLHKRHRVRPGRSPVSFTGKDCNASFLKKSPPYFFL